MSRMVPVALVCAVVFTFITCAQAVEVKSGDRIEVAKRKTLDDDLLAAGNQVIVNGSVNGDVTAVGSTVTISGPVEDSVLLAGATVNVSGNVGNDAWLAGSQINLSSTVEDNAYLAGSMVTVTDEAQVGRDLLIGGASVDVMGDVGRDLRVGGSSVTISGTVGRNARIRAPNITVAESAVINGNLYYPRDARADIAEGATIRGRVIETSPLRDRERRPSVWSAVLGWFGWLIASIVFGLVVVALFPFFTHQTADTLLAMPWASLGIGFVAFIIIPAAAIILMITIIGIPLGLVLLLIYPVLLFVGYVMAAVVVGQLLLRRFRPSITSLLACVALGLLVFSVVGLIPVLGGLVLFLAMLTGFGALLISWWQSRQPRATGTAPPHPHYSQ